MDMAKRDKETGMTSGDMQAYKDLNKELPDPFPSKGRIAWISGVLSAVGTALLLGSCASAARGSEANAPKSPHCSPSSASSS